MSKAKFTLGKLVATPAALSALTAEDILSALSRHVRGDWGELDECDRRENDYALERHLRIFSAYVADNGTTFWVITEADRSATTVLLPEDY